MNILIWNNCLSWRVMCLWREEVIRIVKLDEQILSILISSDHEFQFQICFKLNLFILEPAVMAGVFYLLLFLFSGFHWNPLNPLMFYQQLILSKLRLTGRNQKIRNCFCELFLSDGDKQVDDIPEQNQTVAARVLCFSARKTESFSKKGLILAKTKSKMHWGSLRGQKLLEPN